MVGLRPFKDALYPQERPFSLGIKHNRPQETHGANLLETDFGMNGAALAALGDIEGAFRPSLGERKEGVKLGESTLKVFFMLLRLVTTGRLHQMTVLTFHWRVDFLLLSRCRG